MTGEDQAPVTAVEIRAWVRKMSPQPFDEHAVRPPPNEWAWIYGAGQYELALLARLVDDGFAANRNVHYPRNYGQVSRTASFAATTTEAANFTLGISGTLTSVTVGGTSAERGLVQSGDTSWVTLDAPAGAEIRLDVAAGSGGVPAIAVDHNAPVRAWRARIGDNPWEPVSPRPGGDQAAHLEPAGSVDVIARSIGNSLFDVGAPVLGRPIFPPGSPPRVSSGESIEEALADPWTHETRHDLVSLADGGWTTKHLLGFRYLFVESSTPLGAIDLQASIPAVERPGAFACSDDQLTRIWASSQYTLRLSMQGLMIDGIKRDRMPWAGDQALSTLANAYAIGAGGVVADGLVALGQPGHGYVNGIADYSLWWMVNSELRLRYFGDLAFAEAEAERLNNFVADLAQQADEDGVFRPADQPGGFVDSGPGSVFLDWGVALKPGRDPVALQMLWYWALRSAQRVLEEAGHSNAQRWGDLADSLADTLHRRAWLSRHGRWADYLDADVSTGPAPYANFLAVLSGIHDKSGIPIGVADAIRVGAKGTPFMTAFRLRAMLATGDGQAALDQVREIWGTMLDRGPGTFWEEATLGDDVLAMYGRPFGRSLSHAWASGPAAILPEAILGVRPLGNGWARFEVHPELGDLDWATAVMPAPQGDIVIVATRERTTVQIPAGTVLVRDGDSVHGPSTVVQEMFRARSSS
ncbi:hypothetical protein L1277_002729 [Okibacterium sp. HSC-33S16]|uniref:alpha-L-rhamnosidase-related protein n=1 Tax=Okibacterium sp. HSC-33S16 TaxID=2910965 RepID=UPI0020A0FE2F|nr:hypothetical protein [Okibacterium sp. HSC-33S16]MCP2032619.1 hypothetical protein [Okibacterium sp. HSC-33S16]